MSYLHLKVPPTRDIRLRPCNAYGGNLENLVCGQKEGCLSNNGRTFAQTTGCQLTLSMGMAASIPNTVVIYHGPVGCGAGSLALAGQSKQSQLARLADEVVRSIAPRDFPRAEEEVGGIALLVERNRMFGAGGQRRTGNAAGPYRTAENNDDIDTARLVHAGLRVHLLVEHSQRKK